jgi:hypothetical protein
MVRTGWAIAASLLAALCLAACGTTGSSSSSSPSAKRPYDTYQEIGGYLKALGQVMKPFAHPPGEPTNYPKAEHLVRSNIAQVESLATPTQFTNVQARLLQGLRGELSTLPRFEQGQRTHNAVEINHAEATNLKYQQLVRQALTEVGTVAEACEQQHYAC